MSKRSIGTLQLFRHFSISILVENYASLQVANHTYAGRSNQTLHTVHQWRNASFSNTHLEKCMHVEGTCGGIEKDVAVRAGGRKDKDLAETQDCWSHLLVAALAEERVSRQQ